MRFVVLGCSFVMSAVSLAAVQDVGPTLNKRDKAVMDFANGSAQLAGAAAYCKIDEDLLALYLSRVDSRLATIARDEVELVVARSQFKNIQTVAKGKPPKESCTTVRNNLNQALKNLREVR